MKTLVSGPLVTPSVSRRKGEVKMKEWLKTQSEINGVCPRQILKLIAEGRCAGRFTIRRVNQRVVYMTGSIRRIPSTTEAKFKGVDWSLSNSAIERLTGCAHVTVAKYRPKDKPSNHTGGRPPGIHTKWGAVKK